MKNNKVKICPFCGEEIKITAKKCKYCGEFLVVEDLTKEQKIASETEENKKNNVKHKSKRLTIISTVVISILFIFVLIISFYYFVFYPKQKDKEIIDAFRTQFLISYPELVNNNLIYSDLTEINRTNTMSSYYITVKNDINSITYSFLYNTENKLIEQVLAIIPDCDKLMNSDNVSKMIKDDINKKSKDNKTFSTSDMKNYNEFISYELLKNAENFEIKNIEEKKRNITDLTCNADMEFTIKKSEFKTINVPTSLNFKQCKNELDFCPNINSIGNISVSYKTPTEYEAVKYNEKSTKQYVKDYVTKALGKIVFEYPYPYKDLSGQYAINIDKNGNLLSVRVVSSMDSDYYDSIILNAITNAKYPALPNKYPDKMITIKLVIKLPAQNNNYYENNYYNNSY